jgi:hypothetical protein
LGGLVVACNFAVMRSKDGEEVRSEEVRCGVAKKNMPERKLTFTVSSNGVAGTELPAHPLAIAAFLGVFAVTADLIAIS